VPDTIRRVASNLGRRPSYGPSSPVVGERGVRTRQAILDAAVSTFQAKGLAAPSIDDIADAVGISRATLYQYFESKDQIFAELTDAAAGDLLRVIRRPADLGPTASGYDSLRRWLADWARVQDEYKTLYLQWTVIDFPQGSLRPLIAGYIVEYVSALTSWLGPAVTDDLDVDGTATVLLPLLFRVNDYRERGINRELGDAELLVAVTTFVQLVLFPSTPPAAIPAPAAGRRAGSPTPGRPRAPEPEPGQPPAPSATVQRILDAGAAAFAARGYHATSVQDVLEAAHAGRATFYRHFGDKADLLVMLSRDCMTRLVEQVGRFPGAIGDPAGLRPWIAESLALHRRYQGVFRALLQEPARHRELEELRADSLEKIFRAFDDALGNVERSHFLDARAGSLILLSLLERGPDYQFGTPYDLGEDRIVEILAVVIERGLLGRTPRSVADLGDRPVTVCNQRWLTIRDQ
jgi:AcrR family transcriptional regulator